MCARHRLDRMDSQDTLTHDAQLRVIISADAIELVDVWLCNDVSGAVEKD